MADRSIVWFLEGKVEAGTQQSFTFVADRDYKPVGFNLGAKKAPTGDSLKVDINDDGSSIFSLQPELVAQETSLSETDIFSSMEIVEGSEVTLDIDQIGSGEPTEDLSVQLDLDYD